MQLRKRKFEERPLLSKYISAICKKRRVEKEFFHPSYDLGSSQSINDQFTQLVLKWMKKANKGYAERGKNEGIYFQEDYVREHSDDVFAGFDLSIFGIDISDDSFWHTSDREDQALILNRRLKKGKNRAFSALFQGPTIADCGAVLQMCILRALEEFLGTEGFDKYLDDGREL
ncbi:MAG: hypothetical protein OEY79_04080, partial [Anaplasmataceae bacterium]|nr:hypothetical protein [Anaplasmataceae bacterium]